MYKYKNKSGRISRTFHRFSRVLPALTVLFVLSACSRSTISAERVPASDSASSAASEAFTDKDSSDISHYDAPDTVEASGTDIIIPTSPAGQNDIAAERIKRTYGVDIKYGSEVTWSYAASGTGITDNALIASRLEMLEECLKRYPVSLFSDLKKYSPITINLVDTLGGADGYTDGSNKESIEIALSCDNSDLYFSLAFHHELFHFIEYCIMYNFDNAAELLDTDEYTDTVLYNTDGYSGTIYSTESDIYSQYFTSIYAKTNRLEDRAELFSYYMGNTIKECMRYPDTPISLKMKKISAAIRLCCPSLSDYEPGSLPWEEKIAY